MKISTVQLINSKFPIKLHLVTYEEAKSIIEFLRYQGKTKYEGKSISNFDRFEKDLKVNSIVPILIQDIDLATQTITAKHLFQCEIKN